MLACNFLQLKTFTFLRALSVVARFSVDLLGGGIRIENKEFSEEELSNQMKNGDDHAFEILYERYFDKIYTFIIRRVGQREIAEDLVSHIFLKAFASRARFVWKTSFKSWLYQIANNTLIDHYRSHKSTVEFDPNIHQEPTILPSVIPAIEIEGLRKTLNEVLSKLDARTQKVIQLKFFGEMDNSEIAQIMKISVNHVGVILHRGLNKLKQLKELERL